MEGGDRKLRYYQRNSFPGRVLSHMLKRVHLRLSCFRYIIGHIILVVTCAVVNTAYNINSAAVERLQLKTGNKMEEGTRTSSPERVHK